MKKTIILTILLLLSIPVIMAQESDYLPIVKEGKQWVYVYHDGEQETLATVTIGSDTVIGDNTYKKLLFAKGE